MPELLYTEMQSQPRNVGVVFVTWRGQLTQFLQYAIKEIFKAMPYKTFFVLLPGVVLHSPTHRVIAAPTVVISSVPRV